MILPLLYKAVAQLFFIPLKGYLTSTTTGLCAECPIFLYHNDCNAFLYRKVQCKESASYPNACNFSRILCQCFIFTVIIGWTKASLLMVFFSLCT